MYVICYKPKMYVQELSEALDTTSKTAKGLVLTSSMNSVFCAGLEITEMHDPDPERLRQFWRSLQEVRSPTVLNIFLSVKYFLGVDPAVQLQAAGRSCHHGPQPRGRVPAVPLLRLPRDAGAQVHHRP